ncbi:hypothetical protein GGI23_006361, partial [Coemansia sp. RSA 2559]
VAKAVVGVVAEAVVGVVAEEVVAKAAAEVVVVEAALAAEAVAQDLGVYGGQLPAARIVHAVI